MLQGQKHCLLIFHISLYKLFRYILLPVFVTSYAFLMRNKEPFERQIYICSSPLHISTEIYPFACLLMISYCGMQIAFTVVVFPCLLLQYTGQAAYIAQNKSKVSHAFYYSLPGNVRQRDSTLALYS